MIVDLGQQRRQNQRMQGRAPAGFRRPGAADADPRAPKPDPIRVVPFGIDGAGIFTGHPVGLVVVLGIMFMVLVDIPAARWFFAAALVSGGICGFLLWWRHS